MPTYHFQAFHGLEFDEDAAGVELENDDVARRMAARFARECIRGLNEDIFRSPTWSMRVTDESDKPILHISFRVAEH